MHQRFAALLEQLEAKCQELLTISPVAAGDVPSDTPRGGIYLFSEGDEHLDEVVAQKNRSAFAYGSSSVPIPTPRLFPGSSLVRRLAEGLATRRTDHATICSRTRRSARRTRTRGTGFARCMFDMCTSRSRCDKRYWKSTLLSSPRQGTTTSALIDPISARRDDGHSRRLRGRPVRHRYAQRG